MRLENINMEFKEATTPTLTMDPFKEMDKAEIIEINPCKIIPAVIE